VRPRSIAKKHAKKRSAMAASCQAPTVNDRSLKLEYCTGIHRKSNVHIHSRVSVLVGGMGSEPDEDVIAALREALDARGLDSTGTFAQLEERLVDAVAVEQSPAAVEVFDVDALSITDLKELISKARMSFADCIDKPELRSRAREAAAALAKAESNYQSMFAQPTRTDDATELPSELLTAPEAISDKRALTEQLAALSLKELRGLIKEAGLSPDGCLDKTDLRAKALEALDRLKVQSVKDRLDPSRPLNASNHPRSPACKCSPWRPLATGTWGEARAD
jgi:hypothetical protein